MANEVWRQFESRVLEETRAMGHVITRIPSALTRAAGGRTFRSKTDCDFAGSCDGRAFFLDAKATHKGTFNLKDQVLDPKKIHQYTFLLDAFERGSQAGYLVWFYERKIIAWFSIDHVRRVIESGDKSLDRNILSHQPDDQPINLRRLIWGIT